MKLPGNFLPSPAMLLTMLSSSGFLDDPQVEELAARISDGGAIAGSPVIIPIECTDDRATARVLLQLEKGWCDIEISYGKNPKKTVDALI